jgi:allantoinase
MHNLGHTRGSRADLVLVNLGDTTEITGQSLMHRHRASPYVGYSLRGTVHHTIRRGELIYSERKIAATRRGKLVTPHA